MPINVGNGIRATCDSFGIGQTNFLVNVCIMLVTSVDGLRISMKFTSLICVFVYYDPVESQSIPRRFLLYIKQMASAMPDHVQKYLELSNMRTKMRDSYNEQDQRVKDQMALLEPHIWKFLETQEDERFVTPQFSVEEESRFGKLGTLRVKVQKEQKPMTKTHLFESLKDVMVNKRGMPESVAQECADICWSTRPTVEKRTLDRTFGNPRGGKRKELDLVF